MEFGPSTPVRLGLTASLTVAQDHGSTQGMKDWRLTRSVALDKVKW